LLIYCIETPGYEVTFDIEHKKVYYKAGSSLFGFLSRNDYGNEVCTFDEIGTVVLGYMYTPERDQWESLTCYYPILVFKNGTKFNIFNFQKTSTVGTFVRFGDRTMHCAEQYIESVCIALQRLIFNDPSINSVERLNIINIVMEPKEEKRLRYNMQGYG
jgi:hypothetical protein